MICQQGRGAIEESDLHFSIGKVLQRNHQLQLSFYSLFQPQLRIQKNSDVHVTEVAGLTTSDGTEQISNDHISLLSKIRCHSLPVQVGRFSSRHHTLPLRYRHDDHTFRKFTLASQS